MRIAHHLTPVSSPCLLTIGTYDGVHRGHQFVLQHLIDQAKDHNAASVVLTFSNHPSTVLRPDYPIPSLCTTAHKIRLLKELGIDQALVIPFTKEFSEQTPRQFLSELRTHIPFSHLILGHDAAFGKMRAADQTKLPQLADSFGFNLEYLPEETFNGQQISSSAIRSHLRTGDLQSVEALLGRKFSIFHPVVSGNKIGRAIGYSTANLDVGGLCLPPLGVYAVMVTVQNKKYPAVANLGIAPTVRRDERPWLEVHLLEEDLDLYHQEILVEFHNYIRPEKNFPTTEDLKNQIKQDIQSARKIFP